ncbi:MAG: glutamate racemase [Oscillospiraceae bacterium]|nr:glutamate racemase [Oscillospiraceae bacterium]
MRRGGRLTDRKNCPIAVFDSGLGGISVLRDLRALMPNENYLYFGDSANAPYGTRSLENVRALTLQNIAMLYDRGIKAAVIACNTATSAAVSALRDRFQDIPIIGMEPALKPAALAHPGGTILVLATPLTLREEKFSHLMEHYQDGVRVVPLACPELVEFVERGELESEALLQYLHARLDPWRTEASAAVLGCTHFPFLRAAIGRVLGENAVLYDGGAGTARQTQRQLAQMDLLTNSVQEGTVILENSRNDTAEIVLSEYLLSQIT